jgi:hypothetical protein
MVKRMACYRDIPFTHGRKSGARQPQEWQCPGPALRFPWRVYGRAGESGLPMDLWVFRADDADDVRRC